MWALVLGLVGVSLPAVVVGVLGVLRTRAGQARGRWAAVTGIVTGTLGTALGAALLVLLVLDGDLPGRGPVAAVGSATEADAVAGDDGTGSDGEWRTLSPEAEAAIDALLDIDVDERLGELPSAGEPMWADDLEPYRELLAAVQDSGARVRGDHVLLDGLWDLCAAGDAGARDVLDVAAPGGSEDEELAGTCGRTVDIDDLWCAEQV